MLLFSWYVCELFSIANFLFQYIPVLPNGIAMQMYPHAVQNQQQSLSYSHVPQQSERQNAVKNAKRMKDNDDQDKLDKK